MNISMNSGHIIINGKSYLGNNISAVNGDIIIDGVKMDEIGSKSVNIVINGDVNIIKLEAGYITAQGVTNIQTGSGDVACNNVSGNIKTGSGDVECKNVGGNITTGSGDVFYTKEV